MDHPSDCCLTRQRAKNILATYSMLSFSLGVVVTTAVCILVHLYAGNLNHSGQEAPCLSTSLVS